MSKASFEKDLIKIEEIAKTLEEGKVDLEQAVKLYSQGITLCSQCAKTLENAKMTIEEIEKANAR